MAVTRIPTVARHIPAALIGPTVTMSGITFSWGGVVLASEMNRQICEKTVDGALSLLKSQLEEKPAIMDKEEKQKKEDNQTLPEPKSLP